MPSPKSGTAVSPDAPAAPAAPAEITADPAGELESAAASPSQRDPFSFRQVTIGALDGESAAAPQSEADGPDPEPTITARWSKQRVTPDHNSGWPPATPPTDTVPEEAKAKCIVETTDVPDGTTAEIMVRHCLTDELAEWWPGLQVQGGRVVDPATGNPPEMVFNADHGPYETWDVPFYYFQVEVDYHDLAADTPWEWISREAECLRVMWYHICIADAVADTPAGGGLTTVPEMNEIKGIIDAKQHHKAGKRALSQTRTLAVNRWGSLLRNTYCYHHAGHGDIVDRTTGSSLNAGGRNPPTNRLRNWRSVIIPTFQRASGSIGYTNLGDAEVSQTDAMPSTPRYLVYLDTCVAGWEPSFANAFIARGTQNVIAFRMYIPDGDARAMARRFHRKWIGTHNGDPT